MKSELEDYPYYCNCYLDKDDNIIKCPECIAAEKRKLAREEFDAYLKRRGLI
ncbi:hypothetical protein KY326_03750 [Candidatus Woesearchaeota archaeon]|nr:hypothetical protein [Candidatus Woesearchaeota archaeon]